MSVVSFFTASTSTQKRRERKKKNARKWAPSPIHASRVTTTRKENPIENIPRRALPRRGPLPTPSRPSRLSLPSRGSPVQPLKKNKQGGTHHILREKKKRDPTPKRPRTMLVRPWRYLLGETPIRLQIP